MIQEHLQLAFDELSQADLSDVASVNSLSKNAEFLLEVAKPTSELDLDVCEARRDCNAAYRHNHPEAAKFLDELVANREKSEFVSQSRKARKHDKRLSPARLESDVEAELLSSEILKGSINDLAVAVQRRLGSVVDKDGKRQGLRWTRLKVDVDTVPLATEDDGLKMSRMSDVDVRDLVSAQEPPTPKSDRASSTSDDCSVYSEAKSCMTDDSWLNVKGNVSHSCRAKK
jgi:hypothetical protein